MLIVDDDQDISKIVAEVLSEEGFQISVLRDSQPAVIHAAIARLEPMLSCWTAATEGVTATHG